MNLSHKRLKEILHYNPKTGIFTWRAAHASSQHLIGTRAGCIKDDGGYWVIRIAHKRYYGHRLAWFYMTGKWPKQIDHHDLDKTNNRWSNLRLANKSLNGANRNPPKSNTSGIKGVHYSKRDQRWLAYVTCKGKRYALGHHLTREKAAAASRAKALELFGKFARVA